jgi:hypothetical protein
MEISKIYQIVDATGLLRFESIYKFDTELHLKRLLRSAREREVLNTKSIIEVTR